MRQYPPMIRAAAGIAALSVAAAPFVLAGPAHAASKQEQQQGKQTNVYVEGDSLTVGAAGPLRRKLDPDIKHLGIDAQVGRFTATGMSRLKHDARARHSKVWVLALGTNDGPNPAALKRQVARSLRMAGKDRDVIWLTIKRPGGYDRVNTMLRSMDAQYDNLHVVDWARVVSQHRGLIGGDGVHGTATGYAVRAKLIRDAALPLAQQLPQASTTPSG